MASIFTQIIDGKIPSYKIAEDQEHYAFLDINPVQKGHTLVVPKIEIDRFFDLEDYQLSSLMVFSKRIAAAIKKTIPCDRIGVSVLGLEVPHAHVHLIPLQGIHDMNFSSCRKVFSQQEMQDIANTIAANLIL